MIKQIEERRAKMEPGSVIEQGYGQRGWYYGLKAMARESAEAYSHAPSDIDWLLEDRARLCRKCNDQESEILRLRVENKRLRDELEDPTGLLGAMRDGAKLRSE